MSKLPETVPAMLRWCARERADDVAISTVGNGARRDLTYGEWEARSARVAENLAGRGVRQGVRVVLRCTDDWIAFGVASIAVQWAGGTVVPVGAVMGDSRIARVFAESRAVGLVSEKPVAGCGGWVSTLAGLENEPGQRVPLPGAKPDDVAEIIFTSGTTGTPKGVAATHRNLLWASRRSRGQRTPPKSACTVLHSLPAGSGAGQTLFLQSLSPDPHRLITLSFSPRAYLAAIEQQRPSELLVVPAQAIALVRAGREHACDLSSVRAVRNSGAAISPATLKDLAALFPAATITNLYSSTEAWPARVRMVFDPDRADSVGHPSRGTDLRVVRDGAEVPAGEVGDVEIRAPGAPSRWYDSDPSGSAEVFRADGWTHTGDRGHLDPNGYLYLAGRGNEIINSGGQNLSPIEIEAAIEQHPDVVEACAYGVPHRALGEYVACAVRVGREVDVDGLYDWSAKQLGPARTPKRIHIVDDFPRTMTGKIIKADLARLLTGDEGRPDEQPALAERIGDIWARALGIDPPLDEDSDFLDLGGTSLEAAEVTTEVQELTSLAVRERDLYQAQSLKDYVERVRRADALPADDQAIIRLSPAERSRAD
jgi:long-chain acyl-CoA synthetase